MLLDDQIITRSSGSSRHSINRLIGFIAGPPEGLNRHATFAAAFPAALIFVVVFLRAGCFKSYFFAGPTRFFAVGSLVTTFVAIAFLLQPFACPVLRGCLLSHHRSSGNRLRRHIDLPFNQECGSVLDVSTMATTRFAT